MKTATLTFGLDSFHFECNNNELLTKWTKVQNERKDRQSKEIEHVIAEKAKAIDTKERELEELRKQPLRTFFTVKFWKQNNALLQEIQNLRQEIYDLEKHKNQDRPTYLYVETQHLLNQEGYHIHQKTEDRRTIEIWHKDA